MIRKRGGQTTVELMMILPVFFLMLFFLLELGNIAYHTILAHHTAYEMARVGSMVAVGRAGGRTDTNMVERKLKEQARQMFAGKPQSVTFTIKVEDTYEDPQSAGHINQDLIVNVTYTLKLIFPGSSFIMADPPDKRLGFRKLYASVRMPIERPLLN